MHRNRPNDNNACGIGTIETSIKTSAWQQIFCSTLPTYSTYASSAGEDKAGVGNVPGPPTDNGHNIIQKPSPACGPLGTPR